MQSSSGVHANGYRNGSVNRPANGRANGHVNSRWEDSMEAKIFRKLLIHHIAQSLIAQGLKVPGSLVSEAGFQPGEGFVSKHCNGESEEALDDDYERLQTAFDRLVSRFEQQYQSEVQSFVSNVRITPTSVEVYVLGVVREIFADGLVTWGRIVALTAFIANVALECYRAELIHTIEPLVDCTVRISEEQMVPFIRQNGGWIGFVSYFNVDKREEESANSLPSMGKLVTFVAGVIGVGLLTAFWANKRSL